MSETEGQRFPFQQDVCYTCKSRSGITEVAWGKTRFMSSGEVEFTTEHTLKMGQKVEVAIDWPVLLDQTCPMKIVICGHVIRNDADSAAVKIERYEFRTRAANKTERLGRTDLRVESDQAAKPDSRLPALLLTARSQKPHLQEF